MAGASGRGQSSVDTNVRIAASFLAVPVVSFEPKVHRGGEFEKGRRDRYEAVELDVSLNHARGESRPQTQCPNVANEDSSRKAIEVVHAERAA